MSHECPECGDQFQTEGAMKGHRSQVHGREYQNESVLRRLYHDEGLSQAQIGQRYGVNQNAIKRWMKKHGIETEKFRGDKTRPVYHEFRERPERPIGTCEEIISTDSNGERVTVKVHRLLALAEGIIEFEQFCDTDVKVHHKSGHGWDNRPKNLESVTQAEHRQRHAGTKYRK